jgi:hypothetical protein
MSTPVHTKFRFSTWSLYVLFVLFVFSPIAPSSSVQQKVPVQTEQRDEARPVRTLFHFLKFHQLASENCFPFEIGFFPSLLHYSNSIKVRIKNRTLLVSRFTPIGINLSAYSLPRSGEGLSFSNLG